MPTTSKMGIVYPSSSDLVKDGATNMGTIATTVDSKTGLVLISTTTFSAASSVSLPNNTFTTTFDNYRVILQVDSCSQVNEYTVRFRASGTDNTSNVYYSNRQGSYAYNTGHFSTSTNPSTQSVAITGTDFGNVALGILDITNIAQTRRTFAKVFGNWGYFNTHGTISHDSATAFDSLTFICSGGNITGKVLTYGYNQ